MDGELSTEDTTDLIAQLKKQPDLQNDWNTYHLIGDTLRQSTNLSIDISQSISKKLATEPVILAPQVPKPLKHRMFAVAIAASVVVMVAGWLSLQSLHHPQAPTMIVDRSAIENMRQIIPVTNTISPHRYPLAPAEINDYIFVHGKFSPGTATHELTNYYMQPTTNLQDPYKR